MTKGFFCPNIPVASPGLNDSLLTLIRKILDRVRAATPGYHQVISGITLEILGLVHALSTTHKDLINDVDEQALEKAKFYFRENLENPLDMQALMKELLHATNLNVTEVAYSLGFDSVFYFSKLFKKKNGVSPTEFRAR